MHCITFVSLIACFILSTVASAREDAAARIDALVEAKLAKTGLKPNPPIDDTTFLRRAWLGIAGRVPTLDEASEFQASTYPDKRARLIAELLGSEAHVSHFFHFWADILRLQEDDAGSRNASVAYQLWVKKALRENMPYDRFVAALVSARGKFWENGAVGYYHRDRGMPLDNLANTARIFLGVRLECAQCHNHPFDKWTQMDFYKMAAFSHNMDATAIYAFQQNRLVADKVFKARVSEAYLKGAGHGPSFPRPGLDRVEEHIARHSKNPNDPWLGVEKNAIGVDAFRKSVQAGWAAAKDAEEMNKGAYWAGVELYYPLLNLGVAENNAGLKLPHDYQYADAKPGDVVAPAVLFGATADLKVEKDVSLADTYAKWMTAPDNPHFTRVIANRLWRRAFGHGIIEPVDDLNAAVQPSNPQLMTYLEGLMRELKYDLRAFLGVLYNTKTWQRAASTGELQLGEVYHFPGPLLRRLTAEQLWDSVVGLTIKDADHHRPLLRGQLAAMERDRLMWTSLEGRSGEEYVALMEKIGPIINKRNLDKTKIPELMLAAKKKGDEVELKRLKEEGYRAIEEPLNKAKKELAYDKLQGFDPGKAQPADMMMSAGMTPPPDNAVKPELKLPEPPAEIKSKAGALAAWRKEREDEMRAYWQMWPAMARASELQTPAPRGHFLRDFGQSDREAIENASDNASITQALNLLNGPLINALSNPFTVIGSRINAAPSAEERVRIIFQSMLTREPTPRELDLAKAHMAAEGDTTGTSILWTLLNTRQFLFVR